MWAISRHIPRISRDLKLKITYYYYYLQFAEFFSFIVLKFFKKFVRALKSTALIKATVVKNTTIPS